MAPLLNALKANLEVTDARDYELLPLFPLGPFSVNASRDSDRNGSQKLGAFCIEPECACIPDLETSKGLSGTLLTDAEQE